MKQVEMFKIGEFGKGTLYTMPKPSKDHLTDDMAFYVKQGVTKIVSLLQEDEISRIGLADEEAQCLAHGIAYDNIAIKDASVPTLDAVKPKIKQWAEDLSIGQTLAVHCQGGRGRAGTIAACLLVEMGIDADDALAQVTKARTKLSPDNQCQIDFVKAYR